jgi:Ca2+-binding RTX toxin-like protein
MATRIQRIRMVAAVVAMSTLALAGMASAKVVVGNVGENYLIGTPQKDEISGLAEDDFIVGRGDADDLSGGRGELAGHSVVAHQATSHPALPILQVAAHSAHARRLGGFSGRQGGRVSAPSQREPWSDAR